MLDLTEHCGVVVGGETASWRLNEILVYTNPD
jgi:hypothetical protein